MIMRRVVGLVAAMTLLPDTLPAQQMTVGMVEEMDLAVPELTAGSEYVRVENHPEERVADFVIGPLNLPSDMGHMRLPVQMAECCSRAVGALTVEIGVQVSLGK